MEFSPVQCMTGYFQYNLHSRNDLRHYVIILANEKYYAEWTAAKIFIINYFESAMWITKSCCRAVQDGRLEVQSDPPCTSMCVCVPICGEERICWKGNTNFLLCRLYLAMPNKLLCSTTTNTYRKRWSTLPSKKQEGLHRQKARIHIRIGRVDLYQHSTNFVFQVSQDYFSGLILWEPQANIWTGERKFFGFCFCAAVRKTHCWNPSLLNFKSWRTQCSAGAYATLDP